MTTKRERGRDPEQHVVHAGYDQANIFIGMHGQITGIADVNSDDPKAIVELRFHDGITPGGHTVPLIPAVTTPRSPLTFASVPPEFEVGPEGSLTIHHELGYRPLVQVLAMGTVVAPQIMTSNGTTTLTVAGPASNATNDHTHPAAPVEVEIPQWALVAAYDIEHHDDESLTVFNHTGGTVSVILR